MTWRPDGLLRMLLGWTSMTTLPFWLIFIRGAFDGPTYRWGLFGPGGSGMGGDYWVPALGVVGAVVVLVLGWRGARMPFHWLLLTWHVLLAGLIAYGAVTYGEQFRLQGDTLGISVPLGPVGIVLFGGVAVLTMYWVYRDLRSGKRRDAPQWATVNRRWMWGLVGLMPLQFLLLRVGPPDGVADQVGVVVTIGQWSLLGTAMMPRPGATRRAA